MQYLSLYGVLAFYVMKSLAYYNPKGHCRFITLETLVLVLYYRAIHYNLFWDQKIILTKSSLLSTRYRADG